MAVELRLSPETAKRNSARVKSTKLLRDLFVWDKMETRKIINRRIETALHLWTLHTEVSLIPERRILRIILDCWKIRVATYGWQNNDNILCDFIR
jgi:hypothetical protein